MGEKEFLSRMQDGKRELGKGLGTEAGRAAQLPQQPKVAKGWVSRPDAHLLSPHTQLSPLHLRSARARPGWGRQRQTGGNTG